MEPLQSALSCVSRTVLDARGAYYPAARPHPLSLSDDAAVRLGGNARLSLTVEIGYRIHDTLPVEDKGRWAVTSAMYMYTFYDARGGQLLSYHWHPEGRSPITTPHLHLGASAVTRDLLATAHLPTGLITLIDVIRLAIQDFGVRPLRRDWAAVLDRAHRAFGQPILRSSRRAATGCAEGRV